MNNLSLLGHFMAILKTVGARSCRVAKGGSVTWRSFSTWRKVSNVRVWDEWISSSLGIHTHLRGKNFKSSNKINHTAGLGPENSVSLTASISGIVFASTAVAITSIASTETKGTFSSTSHPHWPQNLSKIWERLVNQSTCCDLQWLWTIKKQTTYGLGRDRGYTWCSVMKWNWSLSFPLRVPRFLLTDGKISIALGLTLGTLSWASFPRVGESFGSGFCILRQFSPYSLQPNLLGSEEKHRHESLCWFAASQI